MPLHVRSEPSLSSAIRITGMCFSTLLNSGPADPQGKEPRGHLTILADCETLELAISEHLKVKQQR